MAYHYERCGAERFRLLCSAVLAPDHPGIVAVTHGATVLARQGLERSPAVPGMPCAHVVFSPAPAVDGSAEWVIAALELELPRIRDAARRASRYIVVTNASRPKPEALHGPGSVQEWLAENCPIPAICLWREDLDRRLDWGAPAIKLAYPEILESAAVGTLVDDMLREVHAHATQSLLALVARQSDRSSSRDAAFIDVPDSSGRGVADVLLSDGAGTARWHVLVGDPGSGKSVVAEHVCQVHRARLLDDDPVLDRVVEPHARVAFRLPISLDAREYADHLRTRPESGGRRAAPFASFLGGVIGGAKSGGPLTPDEVRAIMLSIPVLVVIDRVDELGHRPTRERVTRTSLDYLAKLRADGADIQVIVTSRPEAYGPLPCHARLHTLRLAPLDTEAIIELVGRWLVARASGVGAGARVLRSIAEGVELTDFRSLAATPLHLALALDDLAGSGSTLPGRRADFFDRAPIGDLAGDARTTTVLRDHRHLLADLVQHLAWALQCESESAKSSGTMDAIELASMVRSFLADRAEPMELAARLFDALECLPVLVEGADGRFGFREQFVREFFCAQHLFRSSPCAPTGGRRADDRSARFAALAAHPYWTNVTRFYAGFSEPGALPAVLAGLTKSIASRDVAVSTRGREIGGILLTDRVFRDRRALQDALVVALYDAVGVRLAALAPLGIGYRVPAADCGLGILRNIVLRQHLLSGTSPLPSIAKLLAPIGGLDLWDELAPHLTGSTGDNRTELLSATFAAAAHLRAPTEQIETLIYGDSPSPHALHARLAALLDTPTVAFSHSPRLAHDLIAGLLRRGPSGHASASLRHFATVLGEGDDTASLIDQLASSRDYPRAAVAIEAIRAEFGDSWATFALAAAACGIPRHSEIEIDACSLLDARLPLCDRALAARVWRGSEAWWAEELARARSVTERMFWVVVLVGWGTSNHVSVHLPSIDSVLTELDEEQLPLVVDAVRAALDARQVHGGRRRPPIALPTSIGDRTALLISLSFGSPTLASIAAGRRASELVVRSARQSLFRQRVAAFDSWDALGEQAALRWLGAVSESRLLGDELAPAVADRASRGTMPAAAARRVLRSAGDYPAELVEAALRSIQSARRPTPVGEIAALGWSL